MREQEATAGEGSDRHNAHLLLYVRKPLSSIKDPFFPLFPSFYSMLFFCFYACSTIYHIIPCEQADINSYHTSFYYFIHCKKSAADQRAVTVLHI